MSRKPRKISKSGLYHVVNRGIGKQMIFESGSDYKVFLNMISNEVKESAISVIAFCIMDNHFHFIIYDEGNSLSEFMQKIEEKYAKYYNRKYMRTGYVFQGRFFSECINSEKQLISAIAYVHMNPEKACICKASKYKYSSYMGYKKQDDNIIDVKVIKSLIGDLSNAYNISEENNDERSFSEFESSHKTDIDGIIYIRKVLKLNDGCEIRDFSKKERNKYLVKLKDYGLSIRQIERLTGIGRGIIQNAKM